jgi:hypothetical protein
MLGEWGIAGTTLFAVLLYKAARQGITLYRTHIDKPYRFAAGLAIFTLSITGLFGGIYFFTQTSMYLTIAFTVWIAPVRKTNRH